MVIPRLWSQSHRFASSIESIEAVEEFDVNLEVSEETDATFKRHIKRSIPESNRQEQQKNNLQVSDNNDLESLSLI